VGNYVREVGMVCLTVIGVCAIYRGIDTAIVTAVATGITSIVAYEYGKRKGAKK